MSMRPIIFKLLLGLMIQRRFSGVNSDDPKFFKHIANVSYAGEDAVAMESTSGFSPRMDFDQWRPLTGRGDPLRNDPTYDYEPPVLERVHYWAEDTRLEREHYPERKSELLMLGITSRKPSVSSRQPSLPPKKHYRPLPSKYEDFAYKLNEHYPTAYLVPPPPPLPGQKPTLFVLSEEKIQFSSKPTEQSIQMTTPQIVPSSFYVFQEANLIYQSSTTDQSLLQDINKPIINHAVSSEYAGWGPTTPLNEKYVTTNLIANEYKEPSKHPYLFYKPMLAESPPPVTSVPFLPTLSPNFVPTVKQDLPTMETLYPDIFRTTQSMKQFTTPAPVFTETSTQYVSEETTTEKTDHPTTKNPITIQPTQNILDMLGPMLTMPLVNGPDRPEDNLYAHATENMQVFKETKIDDDVELQTMQSMQPPPIVIQKESIKIADEKTHKYSSQAYDNLINNNMPKVTEQSNISQNTKVESNKKETSINPENIKLLTESPKYLIIQGHSKVKSYSSKPLSGNQNIISLNEIDKPNETNEVKHLHPIKEKVSKKLDISINNRKSKAQNLKALVDGGLGSIEIQEADLGIKYDVSDGSDVPAEIYKKGIVENDLNNNQYYPQKNKISRVKRQIDLEDFLPFDEDTLEEYVFNFLNSKRNDTGITGFIAKVVTSDAASAVDELEDDDR